ncbi:MAG: hypothetical protein CVV24_06760 [Ignavibacteriae bacterium HGW-Ignavibacteriae-3]|nr:MAG: hypothetical protein CVV24_06760 [Ignavibacteriae bacterium HGW-Ignavibacteriae-3]
MKTLLSYLVISIISIAFASCSNPTPTELYNDTATNENVKVEVISQQPAVYVYSNGYDTTGIYEPFIDKSTIISVSGIKNTGYGLSKHEYYFAQFNDKTNPVSTTRGMMLGYKTNSVGIVRFNNVLAQTKQQLMGFHNNGIRRDTVLGVRYEVIAEMMGHGMFQSDYSYNSKINFRLDSGKGNTQFDIPTPPEIIGDVKTQGSIFNKTFQMQLFWNGLGTGQIEVVIGTFKQPGSEISPLLKLVGSDSGKMNVPQNIIENIPSEQRSSLVVTFIRRIIKEIPNNEILNDSYIVSQSIHNIKIQIPR